MCIFKIDIRFSLAVDLLTGFFYILGSVAALTPIPDRIGMFFYLAGSIFLTIRPILRIIKNVFIYDDLKIEKNNTITLFCKKGNGVPK